MHKSLSMRDRVGLPMRQRLFGLASLGGGLLLGAGVVLGIAATAAEAKTPGSTYCFYKKCHRVKTLSETQELVGKDITLATSNYEDCSKDRLNPCGLTSSGEKFHPDRADNAASPIYPDGTVLLVWHEDTGDAAIIRINNAGPYWGERKLDVSYATAEQLGFAKRGVTKLVTRIIRAPDKAEARYSRNRKYHPVPGYIGKHTGIDEAERAGVAAMAVTAIAASMLAPPSGAVAMATQAETKEEAKERLERARAAERMRSAALKIETLPAHSVASVSAPVHTLNAVAEAEQVVKVTTVAAATTAAPVARAAINSAPRTPAQAPAQAPTKSWRAMLLDYFRIDTSFGGGDSGGGLDVPKPRLVREVMARPLEKPADRG